MTILNLFWKYFWAKIVFPVPPGAIIWMIFAPSLMRLSMWEIEIFRPTKLGSYSGLSMIGGGDCKFHLLSKINKLDSSKFVYLLILVFSFILPQSAQADIYRNVGTGKCMNVPGPDRYGNYLNRQISQYNCISNDPEQTFNSDPERDPYRLLRFGKNKSLCWNTINGTTDGAKPFLYVCTWGDSGQMIDYERSIQRLQMSGKGFCIEADATGDRKSVV
jgi:hypothetical protein